MRRIRRDFKEFGRNHSGISATKPVVLADRVRARAELWGDNMGMSDELEQQQQQSQGQVVHKGTGVSASLVVGLILAVLVVILAAQNTRRTSLHFLWWHVRSPLVVIILGTALAGVVVDEFAGLLWRRRRRQLAKERHRRR